MVCVLQLGAGAGSVICGGAGRLSIRWKTPTYWIDTAGQARKVRIMQIGRINKLVHLSQQTYQPNSKLIPGHNDKDYVTVNDENGREIYFLHDAVPGSRGFDDLYRGQTVEYTLEDGPYLRANFVCETAAVPNNGQRPTVKMPGEEQRKRSVFG
jgi:hypothetical protein